jgi:hypothetical protein
VQAAAFPPVGLTIRAQAHQPVVQDHYLEAAALEVFGNPLKGRTWGREYGKAASQPRHLYQKTLVACRLPLGHVMRLFEGVITMLDWRADRVARHWHQLGTAAIRLQSFPWQSGQSSGSYQG